jgi:hypothetical protein
MKQGKSWSEIESQLERIAEGRRDFLAPSRLIDIRQVGEDVALELPQERGTEAFRIRENAHEQLASWLNIPRPYYERMRREAPGLYRTNVRHWLETQERSYLLRTLGGELRAVLSTRYRPLDNDALARAVVPVLEESEFEITSAEVTDSRLDIKAVSLWSEEAVNEGDIVRMAVSISNSEIGAGALRFDPMLYFLACTNGLILREDRLRKTHVGRDSGDFDSAREFFRDETKEADDLAFWMKVRDALRGILSPDRFRRQLALLSDATGDAIAAGPEKVVEVTAKRFRFNDEEQGAVLTHFIRGHAGREELTRYGLAQAVSRASQDVPSYARATELEQLSGAIIEMTPSQWRPLAHADGA